MCLASNLMGMKDKSILVLTIIMLNIHGVDGKAEVNALQLVGDVDVWSH